MSEICSALGVAAWLEPAVAGHGTHEQLGLEPCTFLALMPFGNEHPAQQQLEEGKAEDSAGEMDLGNDSSEGNLFM